MISPPPHLRSHSSLNLLIWSADRIVSPLDEPRGTYERQNESIPVVPLPQLAPRSIIPKLPIKSILFLNSIEQTLQLFNLLFIPSRLLQPTIPDFSENAVEEREESFQKGKDSHLRFRNAEAHEDGHDASTKHLHRTHTDTKIRKERSFKPEKLPSKKIKDAKHHHQNAYDDSFRFQHVDSPLFTFQLLSNFIDKEEWKKQPSYPFGKGGAGHLFFFSLPLPFPLLFPFPGLSPFCFFSNEKEKPLFSSSFEVQTPSTIQAQLAEAGAVKMAKESATKAITRSFMLQNPLSVSMKVLLSLFQQIVYSKILLLSNRA